MSTLRRPSALPEVPDQSQGGGEDEDDDQEQDPTPTSTMPPAPPPSGAEPAFPGGNPFGNDAALGVDAGNPFEGHDEEDEEEEGLDESLVDQIGNMSMANGPDGSNPFEADVDDNSVDGGMTTSAVGGNGR